MMGKSAVMNQLQRLGRIITLAAYRYSGDEHARRAVVLTYYTMFAVVPLAALFFGVAKGFALEAQLHQILALRFLHHNQELFRYISDFAERTLRGASGGVIAGAGIIILLWTVIWLITNIESAFNAVWQLPGRRNWWRKISDYLALMLLTPVMMVAVSTAGVFLRRLLTTLAERMPLLAKGNMLFEIGTEVVPFAVICFLLTLIYRFTPNTRVHWSSALMGGIVAGVAFQLLQEGFILLQGTVFNYNRLYGSFAVLPLFLIWLNWSWQIVLFGAELCFVDQNLDSGIFDGHAIRQLTLRLRCEHQLAILKEVFCFFCNQGGALPEKELFMRFKLPELLLKNEINELVEKKLLCRTFDGEEQLCLLPGVPPESFTLSDFLHRSSGDGDETNAEFASGSKLLTAIELEIASGKGGTLIKDI